MSVDFPSAFFRNPPATLPTWVETHFLNDCPPLYSPGCLQPSTTPSKLESYPVSRLYTTSSPFHQKLPGNSTTEIWISWYVSQRSSRRAFLYRSASPSWRSSKHLGRCIVFPCRGIAHQTLHYPSNRMRSTTFPSTRSQSGMGSWTRQTCTSRSISTSARTSRVGTLVFSFNPTESWG